MKYFILLPKLKWSKLNWTAVNFEKILAYIALICFFLASLSRNVEAADISAIAVMGNHHNMPVWEVAGNTGKVHFRSSLGR
jgi:hypothetical protein